MVIVPDPLDGSGAPRVEAFSDCWPDVESDECGDEPIGRENGSVPEPMDDEHALSAMHITTIAADVGITRRRFTLSSSDLDPNSPKSTARVWNRGTRVHSSRVVGHD